jgi:hypothetical protein
MSEYAGVCCCGGYGFCQAPVTINAEGRCAYRQVTIPGLLEWSYSASAKWINVVWDQDASKCEWEGIFEFTNGRIYNPIPNFTNWTKTTRIHMKGTRVNSSCTTYSHACYEDSPPEGDGWNNRVIMPVMPTTLIQPDPDNPPLYRYEHVGGEILEVYYDISGINNGQTATRENLASPFCNYDWAENQICQGVSVPTDPTGYLRWYWTVHAWSAAFPECSAVPQGGVDAPPPSFPYNLKIVDNTDTGVLPDTAYTDGYARPFNLWYRELDGSVEAVGRFTGFPCATGYCSNCDPYPIGDRTPYHCDAVLKSDACGGLQEIVEDFYTDIAVT